jgi:glycosyltransferase involved in cell wall biosynthesis|nr:glycosyltransferase family 4 protein [Flavobacterium sp. UBA6135]
MWFAIVLHSRKADVVLIDVYSTLNFWYAYSCSLLCRVFDIPYIPILHGGNLPARFQKNPKQAMALVNSAYKTVIPSAYLKQHLTAFNLPRVEVIPNTIDLANYSFKQRSNLQPNLLWVRAIDSIYNPEMALQTLALVREEFPEAKLTMVGPYKSISETAWQQTLKKYKLPVRMTGKVTKEEWIALAASHSVFVNTTTIDNMPVSVIEAMALGLPVVSTDVGGIPYLIQHEVSGLLVPSNDAPAMAQAVIRLLQSEKDTATLTLNARKVIEKYDWRVVSIQWKALFEGE